MGRRSRRMTIARTGKRHVEMIDDEKDGQGQIAPNQMKKDVFRSMSIVGSKESFLFSWRYQSLGYD